MKLTIVVLNFGEEHANKIAHIFEQFGFRAQLLDYSIRAQDISDVAGIVFSGGPKSVLEPDAETVDAGIFQLGVPILGICYGMHLIVKHLGGEVVRKNEEEGTKSLEIINTSPLFETVPNPLHVWMGHQDQVRSLPLGFEVLAKTENCPIAGAQSVEEDIYLVQFHPERVETQDGSKILEAFASLLKERKEIEYGT